MSSTSFYNQFGHLQISLDQIASATNDFSDENLIRRGGFGKTYRGQLRWSGQLIDIVARRLDPEYKQGMKEFLMELSMLSTLKHDNLVSIIGFCDEKGEKIIINKHETHGSLDKCLRDPNLTWIRRLDICVGVARALSYIHYDKRHNFSVIHRNVKSSKILLDDNWKPKLSGFELSIKNIVARRHRFLVDRLSGTIGYIDPKYEKTGVVTHKSDVYSFGVVLFEVLCGRRAFTNPQWFSTQLAKQCSPAVRLSPQSAKQEGTRPDVGGNTDDVIIQQEGSSSSHNLSAGPKPSINLSIPMERSSSTSARMTRVPSSRNFSAASRTASGNLAGGKPSSRNICEPMRPSSSRNVAGPSRTLSMQFNNFSVASRTTSFGSLTDGIQLHNFSGENWPEPSSTNFKEQWLSSPNRSFGSLADENWPEQSRKSMVQRLSASPNKSSGKLADGLPSASVITNGEHQESNISTEQRVTLNPLDMCMFTLAPSARFHYERRFGHLCIPEEELLAPLAISHYEEERLHDLIDPDLWKQMDPLSFDVFSKTAYLCLKEQRSERPDIDQVVNRLQEALYLQWNMKIL